MGVKNPAHKVPEHPRFDATLKPNVFKSLFEIVEATNNTALASGLAQLVVDDITVDINKNEVDIAQIQNHYDAYLDVCKQYQSFIDHSILRNLQKLLAE